MPPPSCCNRVTKNCSTDFHVNGGADPPPRSDESDLDVNLFFVAVPGFLLPDEEGVAGLAVEVTADLLPTAFDSGRATAKAPAIDAAALAFRI